jgi:hypothetical protein
MAHGRRRGFYAGFELCPNGESLLTCNDKPSIVEGYILPHSSIVHVSPAKMPVSQPGECFLVSRAQPPQ